MNTYNQTHLDKTVYTTDGKEWTLYKFCNGRQIAWVVIDWVREVVNYRDLDFRTD